MTSSILRQYANTNALPAEQATHYTERYRKLLKRAEIECPAPDEPRQPGQRGRVKRSRARNLLERLQLFELDVLRFMTNPIVPFTNNQGENDIRMTKVHQKKIGLFSVSGRCEYLLPCSQLFVYVQEK
jgi:transposase